MPYIGNVTTDFNVGTDNINNGAVTGEKLSLPFNYDSGTLYLDSTNNRVGIGTTSPQTLLHLFAGTGTAAYATFSGNNGSPDPFLIGQDASGLTRLFQTSTQPITFWTNSTERLRIESTGTILAKGTERISFNTYVSDANHAGYIGRDTSTGALLLEAQNAGGGYPMIFRTNSTERLRLTATGEFNFKGAGTAGSSQAVSFNGSAPINSLVVDSNGRLGVGTSTASANLHIKNTSTTAAELLRLEANFTDPSGNRSITWADATNVVGRISVDYASQVAKMRFGSLYSSGYQTSDLMTLTPAGLGIGTTSPGTVLDIVGAGNPTLTLRGSDGAYTGILNIQAAGGGSSVINATGGSVELRLQTNGVNALYINPSQRVGIGTSSPGHSLQVSGAICATGTFGTASASTIAPLT
jgi:hypothetical protein